MGPIKGDGLLDISLNQSDHEDDFDSQSFNLASLKPLCISSLSVYEGPLDLFKYMGDCVVDNLTSYKDLSDYALGI